MPGPSEVLNDLPPSQERRIFGEIEKFQTGWTPNVVFEKPVSTCVEQIKKDRSKLRAFGTYWSGGGYHILFVLAVYTKSEQNEYFNRVSDFDRKASDLLAEFDRAEANGEIESSLESLQDQPGYEVIPP